MSWGPSDLPGLGALVAAVRSSYRRKLATALLVVLCVSSLALFGLYVQIDGLLRANVEQSMTAGTNAEADELSEWTSKNRLVARTLSADPVYESRDDDAIRQHLDRNRNDWRVDVVNAYVIDRRNQTVEVSVRRDLEGTAVGNLPWDEEFGFRSFEDVEITEPYPAERGTTVVGFVTPIRRTPGHVLVVAIDAASVFERFEHPVEDGFTRVVDSNGSVVFADNQSVMLRQYRADGVVGPAVRRGLDGESGFTTDPSYEDMPRRQGEYVVAYAPVRGTDWVVLEHAPASSAYAVRNRVRLWIGVVGVITVAGLLGVVSVLGRDVTIALAGLSRRAERIAAGEYDVDFDTNRPDEFGDLNRTLATARDRLRRRFTEIQETRDALEASNAALENRTSMVSVLHRVLRHNVRNDVNVIAGRAEYVARRVDDDEVTGELDVIQRKAHELASLSDRTQRIKQILAEEDAERGPIQVYDRLETALREVDAAHEDATVSVEAVGEGPFVADAIATFPLAVVDTVETILESNDGPVSVTVTVAREASPESDGAVMIILDDDGDGLPEQDVRSVDEGEEAPLNHAEGLSLWCLEWASNVSGGELVVDSDDATVEIGLLPAEARSVPRR